MTLFPASSLACWVRVLSQHYPSIERPPQTFPISWCPGVVDFGPLIGLRPDGERLGDRPFRAMHWEAAPGRLAVLLCILLARDKHFLFPIDYTQILLPFSSIPGMLSSSSSHGENPCTSEFPGPFLVNGLAADHNWFCCPATFPVAPRICLGTRSLCANQGRSAPGPLAAPAHQLETVSADLPASVGENK